MAAVSCGIFKNNILLDLDYDEDSNADVDANFVITENMELAEIQSTGEKRTFSEIELTEMLKVAKNAAKILIERQNACFE